MKLDCKMRNRIVFITICVVCVTLLLVLLIANAAISINPFDNGGCISVALDRSLLAKADRVIIRIGENQYETIDPDVIRQIVSETKVATNTDLRYPKTDRWIDVYCGSSLIRSMRWADNHDTIVVYNADTLHWVFPSMEGHGIIHPSEELIEILNAIIHIEQSPELSANS